MILWLAILIPITAAILLYFCFHKRGVLSLPIVQKRFYPANPPEGELGDLSDEFSSRPSVGSLQIYRIGNNYRATVNYPEATVKLSSPSHEALFNTLLELKAIKLSVRDVLSRLTAIEVLRLHEIWHQKTTEQLTRRSVDVNLLLYGLCYQGIKGRPDRWKTLLTEFGVHICKELFWGMNLDYPKNKGKREANYALQWGEVGNTYWKFFGPLRARYLEGREMTPDVYEEFDPSHWWKTFDSLRDVDWPTLHASLERLSLEFPSFMPQMYAWHQIELARRLALFP